MFAVLPAEQGLKVSRGDISDSSKSGNSIHLALKLRLHFLWRSRFDADAVIHGLMMLRTQHVQCGHTDTWHSMTGLLTA